MKRPSKPKRIPISIAKDIARKYDYDQVIIYARCISAEHGGGGEAVTTYGKTKKHCDAAARIGKALVEQVVRPLKRLTDMLIRERAEVLDLTQQIAQEYDGAVVLLNDTELLEKARVELTAELTPKKDSA